MAIGAAADALCCQQAGARAFAGGNVGTGLFKPVAAKIGERRNPVGIQPEKRVNVGVAQFLPNAIAAKERRVADDEVNPRPFRFAGFADNGVHAPDVF